MTNNSAREDVSADSLLGKRWESCVKLGWRSLFDPAVQLMNRLSYPQKFAVAGSLFALPLLFVTWLYIASLTDKVEISVKAQSGSRALRLIVPIWRTLCDHRRFVLHNTSDEIAKKSAEFKKFREALDSHVSQIADAKSGTRAVLELSSRWELFENKLHAVRSLPSGNDSVLDTPAMLNELIDDQLVIFRQIAEVSQITADTRLDSQNLAMASTRLLPGLIEAEERLDQLFDARRDGLIAPVQFDVEATETLFNLRVLLEQVREGLFASVQDEPELASQLKTPLNSCRTSLLNAERAMRSIMRGDENAPTFGEIEVLNHEAVRDSFNLLFECMDAFDRLAGERLDETSNRRMLLLLIALIPVAVAIYLGVGFCLAVIRTVDRMRDVTDLVLANDWRGHEMIPIEAQDELGRMIGDFRRLTVRLREECAAATAESERATAEAKRATETEESLRVSEERFKLALCGTNDGIWDWDLESDQVFYSDRFKELLGISR
jgi:PAS domain-containing protein